MHHHRLDHRPGLRAFSLLELVMVVAIILVLASLLLAVLAGAKVRAQSSRCLSQLRQLGVAMSVYGSDNNELLPAAHTVVTWDSTNPVAWTKAIFPKPTPPAFLTCPSYSRFYYQSPFSYFMGSRSAFVEAGAQAASLSLRHITLPTQYILSGDCNFPFQAIDADPDNYTADTLFGLVPVGHDRRVNVLFADFHVIQAKRFEADSMTFSATEAGKSWGE
jgi:prepilin-type processing-associated H-X9-DG protein